MATSSSASPSVVASLSDLSERLVQSQRIAVAIYRWCLAEQFVYQLMTAKGVESDECENICRGQHRKITNGPFVE